jgi:hypothetical protein
MSRRKCAVFIRCILGFLHDIWHNCCPNISNLQLFISGNNRDQWKQEKHRGKVKKREKEMKKNKKMCEVHSTETQFLAQYTTLNSAKKDSCSDKKK